MTPVSSLCSSPRSPEGLLRSPDLHGYSAVLLNSLWPVGWCLLCHNATESDLFPTILSLPLAPHHHHTHPSITLNR